MEPWQALPSPLLSSLLFFSSPLFFLFFFLPCQAAPDVRSINTLSAVRSVCVCVYTRISQHKAMLFSPSVGFLPSHLDRKAKPEFCWETEKCHGEVCVCATKWWGCGSCDWIETLILFLFFSRWNAALLICFHGLPALADVLERQHVPEPYTGILPKNINSS